MACVAGVYLEALLALGLGAGKLEERVKRTWKEPAKFKVVRIETNLKRQAEFPETEN